MDSRLNNSTRNIFAGLINKVLLILFPFISRTAIIYALGSEYLGLNSLFSSILMVLNLSELGIGSALVYSMYKPIADDDKVKICALLAAYKKWFRVIGLILLIVGLILIPFLKYLIKGEVPSDINLYLLYILYLLNTSLGYFVFAEKRALLTAYQRSDVVSNINSFVSLFLHLAQILILFLSGNFYLFIAVYPICTFVENMCINRSANKLYPELFCTGNITEDVKGQIRKHVKGIALQKICSSSRNTFDSIIISMYLGLISIAIYSNYYYIMISVHEFLYLIPNSIRASVGNSVAKESLDKNYNDFCSMYFIYSWISGWCTTCLVCLYQPFMDLWVGNSLMLPISSVLLFCLYFTLLNAADIVALYKDAAGLWWHGRYRVIIEAVANLILNFTLGFYFGINGVLIATIITLLLLGNGYGGYIVFHYYFRDESFIKFIREQILYILAIAAVALVTMCLCNFVDSIFRLNKVYTLIIRGLNCIIIPNLLFLLLYSKHKHMKQAMVLFTNSFNSVVHKRK